MITITLQLSESLLCILREQNALVQETSQISVEPGMTVREFVISQGIPPLLVPMVSFKEDKENRRIDMTDTLTCSGVLTLYGPLAGG